MPTKYLRGDLETSGDYLKLRSTSASAVQINSGSNASAISLNLPGVNAGLVGNANGGDVTKVVGFNSTGASASTSLTLTAPVSANRNWTFPDASSTFVGVDVTQTLTNKTLDATANTISKLGVSNFDAANITTNLSTSATSTQLPRADATKSYVDTAVAAVTAASVPNTRTISTPTGSALTGGGDLSANRTLQVIVDNSSLEIATNTIQIKALGVTDAKVATGISAVKIGTGTVDNTEFGYLDGVTSAIQTQLNGKQTTGNYITALTGDVTAAGPGSASATIANAAVTDAKVATGISAAKIGAGTVDNTEFGYLDGVTSAIQTQLNGKQATGSYALTTGTLAQFAATTSAQLAGVISDETGSGALVFATSPTLVTPNLGTPSAITLTNGTGLDLNTGTTNTLSVSRGGTGQTTASTAFAALAPLTTKGDLLVYTTTTARLGVGSDGQVLVADSASPAGVKWANNTAGFTNPMTSAGDMIYGGTGGTATRLPAGTSAQVLISQGAAAPTWNTLSGDVTISNTGVTTIGASKITSSMIVDGTIVDADINAAAAIAGTKVSPNFGSQNITTTGTISGSDLVGGRYTPTLTGNSNVGTLTATSCLYSRVKNIVTVSGLLAVTSGGTVGGAVRFFISLPINSNFTSASDCAGTGTWKIAATNTNGWGSAHIIGDTSLTIDRAEVYIQDTVINTQGDFSFTFQYEVK